MPSQGKFAFLTTRLDREKFWARLVEMRAGLRWSPNDLYFKVPCHQFREILQCAKAAENMEKPSGISFGIIDL